MRIKDRLSFAIEITAVSMLTAVLIVQGVHGGLSWWQWIVGLSALAVGVYFVVRNGLHIFYVGQFEGEDRLKAEARVERLFTQEGD